MQLAESAAEARFRQEVRQFIANELPFELRRQTLPGAIFGGGSGFESSRNELMPIWLGKLSAVGWTVPAWPRRYGGAELSVGEQFILNEEMALARAPKGLGGMGVGWVGPTIIEHGTDAQRQEHLPGIAAGRTIWCQGFSETGAGSDLASLQTRATRQGDSYVVRGQKIWTSLAHLAHWMILLARTDAKAPKHKGISCFLVPMQTQGIRIRPIVNMAGHHDFNEVFLDDIVIPRSNLVGEENMGWYIGASTLDFERSNISTSLNLLNATEELAAWLRTKHVGRNFTGRYELADRYVECHVARLLSYNVISLQKRGILPNREASLVKLYTSELDVRIWSTAAGLVGLWGQVMGGSQAPFSGRVARNYLYSTTSTVGGGTSEIQRNVIAHRALGLPR